jgi:hypothetical protein
VTLSKINQRWIVALFVFYFLSHISPFAEAETQTITATHTYMMGDNDSKNDARRMCFLEAKRAVLEKAGIFIESFSEVKNFQLTKDQINSYTAAVLSVETVKEDFRASNGQNTITLTVKADVDTSEVRKRLAAIVTDKGLQEKIAAQQQQIKKLEEQMQSLNASLDHTSQNSSIELRKERNVVWGNIQELENRKLAAVQVIEDLSEKVDKYIVVGMTMQEVKNILGNPRGEKPSLIGNNSWNYGRYWIHYEGGVVWCISEDQNRYRCPRR